MKPKVAVRVTVLLAVVITLLSTAGAYLAVYWDNNAPYIVVAIGTAATCFFGLLALTQANQGRWELTEESMRTAIAGTIVVVYLILVGIVTFFVAGPTVLPGITQTMVTNFTTVVGIVVVFYFGSSAYIQAVREKKENGKAKADERSQAATATPSEVRRPDPPSSGACSSGAKRAETLEVQAKTDRLAPPARRPTATSGST